ncbi:MAG TPA: protein kinase [Planctomycetaceae bacterium]|nr:protein kinase [Planctomycetaceae bacterium]
MTLTATQTAAESSTRKPIDRRSMPQIKSKDGLKSFLITSRLLSLDEWNSVDEQIPGASSLESMLQILERRQLLTPLQTGRIQKGETEGLVLGNYKLLYRNASGSFARVFRASSVDDGRVVALKLLRERWADDARTVASFEREARLCQKFIHPNIVPIYEIGNEGRFHFFTMEFVEGGNLRDFLKIRRTLSPPEATRCILQICQGLEYALKMGASHRDLKLTNVLMSSTGIAKLVDFGLAGAESPSQAGTSDEVQRALEYASLERGTNAPRNDPRSDLFFAGAIYYELLVGEGPWARTRDREEKMLLSRYANIRPVESCRPDLPQSIARICGRMLEVSPSSRYQTASEVVRDLRAVMSELGQKMDDVPSGKKPIKIELKPDFRLLVVDTLKKRLSKIKEYFESKGFDVAFAKSPEFAFNLLKAQPPDGILFLADNNTEEILTLFPQVQAYARSQKVPCLAVFPAEEEEVVKKKIVSTRFGTTMFQPATLRDIRMHFE